VPEAVAFVEKHGLHGAQAGESSALAILTDSPPPATADTDVQASTAALSIDG